MCGGILQPVREDKVVPPLYNIHFLKLEFVKLNFENGSVKIFWPDLTIMQPCFKMPKKLGSTTRNLKISLN